MYEFIEYRVADAMTQRPVTVRPDMTLAEVEALFERYDYDCLPVCGRDGRLIGVVTKLDFLRAFAFTRDSMIPRYDEIMARPAASVMTAPATTVTPDTPLTRVIQLMAETRHKSFPVTSHGALRGMISRRDVVRALRRAVGGERVSRSNDQKEGQRWTRTAFSQR
jgi:CBS domain-containing protein